MMNSHVQLIELCLIAAVGIHAPRLAAADTASGTRDHSYAYLASGGYITMSGDAGDIVRARNFKQSGGPLLWFREGGHEYVVRDRKHDQLDRKRDAIESRRDDLADRESELADRESDDALAPAAKSELARQRRELQQQRQALDGELRALEQPMNELRAQMDALRHQLDAIHQKQKLASSKEETEVRALFRRFIAAGTAKLVK